MVIWSLKERRSAYRDRKRATTTTRRNLLNYAVFNLSIRTTTGRHFLSKLRHSRPSWFIAQSGDSANRRGSTLYASTTSKLSLWSAVNKLRRESASTSAELRPNSPSLWSLQYATTDSLRRSTTASALWRSATNTLRRSASAVYPAATAKEEQWLRNRGSYCSCDLCAHSRRYHCSSCFRRQ